MNIVFWHLCTGRVSNSDGCWSVRQLVKVRLLCVLCLITLQTPVSRNNSAVQLIEGISVCVTVVAFSIYASFCGNTMNVVNVDWELLLSVPSHSLKAVQLLWLSVYRLRFTATITSWMPSVREQTHVTHKWTPHLQHTHTTTSLALAFRHCQISIR